MPDAAPTIDRTAPANIPVTFTIVSAPNRNWRFSNDSWNPPRVCTNRLSAQITVTMITRGSRYTAASTGLSNTSNATLIRLNRNAIQYIRLTWLEVSDSS